MYCTAAQLEDRVTAGVLGSYFSELGAERLRVLNGYASRASARVDAALSARYSTPVASSELLSDICQSIALWQMAADRGSLAGEIPAAFQKPYEEAMATLGRIASGELALPGVPRASDGASGLEVVSPPARIAPDSPGMGWF